MTSLADRLRGVLGPGGGLRSPREERSGGPLGPHESCSARPEGARDPADTLDGEWRERGGQRYLVIDRRYAPGYRHGGIAVADTLPPDTGVWPQLSLLAGAPCAGRMLFIDLETTGLAGGAGTYAFLVGCAWFEPPSRSAPPGHVGLRTRQFFLSSYSAERVLLEAVAEAADESGTVITYNGKSFDLPVMETRFVMHRMPTPFTDMPHVDMLHPARRLWREADSVDGDLTGRSGTGCRLTRLEETLCGHQREGDVPGFEIPSRYFHYVRTGDARALAPVMEHNRLDLLSLALVTARASQLLEDGPAAARTAREALGIGRLYERAGLHGAALGAFERAAALPDGDVVTQAEALRACAVLQRRERRHAEAAEAWQRLVQLRGCPAHMRREAMEALAVHHEHRLRDLRAARSLALESMRLSQSAARREAVQHRLARLDRKLGGDITAAPLF
jgi:uncharacterized protein YprB with RNaseH-like and TPR domain